MLDIGFYWCMVINIVGDYKKEFEVIVYVFLIIKFLGFFERVVVKYKFVIL